MAKKKKGNPGLVVAVIVFLVFLFKIYVSPMLDDTSQQIIPPLDNTDSQNVSESVKEPEFISDGNLEIHYIDVGQADSILIKLNNSSMLIDAGNNADGSDVVEYLKRQNISTLDYLIGTHPHEDHIGGMDNVIKSFNIKTIIMPKASNTTKTFEDILDAIKAKKLTVTTPNIGDVYQLDSAKFTILSCKNATPKELNLVSIVLKLEYGNQSYLFTGDAEEENEEEMLKSGYNLSANVLKVGHHGSTSSTSQKFLNAVNPEIAIICVGTDNDYGHPHKETLTKLKNKGVTIYRTDLEGTIIIVSDGTKNEIRRSK